VRLVGYLPNNDFIAALKNGLGRIAFVQKKYADAERWYGDVVAQFGDSHFALEAMYWRAVAQYSTTHDHMVLGKVAEELRGKYPSSVREQGSSMAAVDNIGQHRRTRPSLSSRACLCTEVSANSLWARSSTIPL